MMPPRQPTKVFISNLGCMHQQYPGFLIVFNFYGCYFKIKSFYPSDITYLLKRANFNKRSFKRIISAIAIRAA